MTLKVAMTHIRVIHTTVHSYVSIFRPSNGDKNFFVRIGSSPFFALIIDFKKSCQFQTDSHLAQLVERLTLNLWVCGSNLPQTKHFILIGLL